MGRVPGVPYAGPSRETGDGAAGATSIASTCPDRGGVADTADMIPRRTFSRLLWALALGALGAVSARPHPVCAQTQTAYSTRGVIRSVADDRRSVRIAHEAIPGFMNAMTMIFLARDPAQLQGIGPNDRVTLRFTATSEGQLWIDSVSRAP